MVGSIPPELPYHPDQTRGRPAIRHSLISSIDFVFSAATALIIAADYARLLPVQPALQPYLRGPGAAQSSGTSAGVRGHR